MPNTAARSRIQPVMREGIKRKQGVWVIDLVEQFEDA